MKSATAVVLVAVACLAGCRAVSQDKPAFHVYIESWDRVSFDAPRIVEGEYSKWLSKDQATQVIQINHESFAPRADVMLGKNLHINDAGLDSEMDEIQGWLVSCGIEEITFRLAASKFTPPVVREYRNGKITKPRRANAGDGP